ncbi:MAG TPA: nucleotidyltransferase [Ignavibacteriaceae bacterium]|nr:nucleotidyltransferase [Ignavibacteriaceae bacterium]HRQ54283.1 nucleotidyltransferase [Ignavibacteriaceae bacterium]
MRVEKDFEDFIELLNKNDVKYMIVGAYALALYARPRNTGDIDVFVERDEKNAKKILQVLSQFGFESIGIVEADLLADSRVVQLGVSPVRIDIMNRIDGVNFNDAYKRVKNIMFGNTPTKFISYEDLLQNKLSSNRKKDQADLEELQNYKP